MYLHIKLFWFNMYNTWVRQVLYGIKLRSFLAVCSPVCSNGGTCSSPNTCTCPSTYTGTRCTTRKFKVKLWVYYYCTFDLAICSSSCQNSGTCSAPNTCTCTSSYTGSTCTIRKIHKIILSIVNICDFLQPFVHRPVKMVVHAAHQTLALVLLVTLAPPVQHVRRNNYMYKEKHWTIFL